MKNRKNKVTNFFKIGVLLFGITLLLWNCQKEETVEQNIELIQNNISEFSRASINDLIKEDETFFSLSENYLIGKISSKSTLAKSNTNDLIITSDTINVIEKENYKSYTIRIKRNGYDYNSENLIIEQKSDIKSAYILSYNFDNKWVADNLKGEHTQPKGKVYYSEFDISKLNSKTQASNYASRNCRTISITIIIPCTQGNHYYRPPCTGSPLGNRFPVSHTISHRFCGGGNSNDFGGPLDTDNNSGGGLEEAVIPHLLLIQIITLVVVLEEAVVPHLLLIQIITLKLKLV